MNGNQIFRIYFVLVYRLETVKFFGSMTGNQLSKAIKKLKLNLSRLWK